MELPSLLILSVFAFEYRQGIRRQCERQHI